MGAYFAQEGCLLRIGALEDGTCIEHKITELDQARFLSGESKEDAQCHIFRNRELQFGDVFLQCHSKIVLGGRTFIGGEVNIHRSGQYRSMLAHVPVSCQNW